MKLQKIFRLGASLRYIAMSAAAVGALAAATQANAADVYAPPVGGFKDVPVVMPPPPTWTGFYAGVNMGAAWSELQLNRNSFNYNTNATPLTCSAVATSCFGGERLNSTNAFGGGQFGYNWQGWSNFVFGVEVDLLGVGGGNGATFVGFPTTTGGILPAATNTIVANVKQDGGFAGDVTGRLGYAWGNWMLYAKGGWAWFNPELSASVAAYNSTGGTVATFNGWDNSRFLSGWTVGGGIEWLLNPNWSVKVEYLYYDYGLDNRNWTATYNGTTYNKWKLFDDDLTVHTVKLGVNYHLTNSYVPIK